MRTPPDVWSANDVPVVRWVILVRHEAVLAPGPIQRALDIECVPRKPFVHLPELPASGTTIMS